MHCRFAQYVGKQIGNKNAILSHSQPFSCDIHALMKNPTPCNRKSLLP